MNALNHPKSNKNNNHPKRRKIISTTTSLSSSASTAVATNPRQHTTTTSASAATMGGVKSSLTTTSRPTVGTCDNVSERYEKVGRVGQGTYGVVYKARDRFYTKKTQQQQEKKNPNTKNNEGKGEEEEEEEEKEKEYVALKRCIPHHESSDGFPVTTLREIHALRVCSQHPNVIKLLQVAVSTSTSSSSSTTTTASSSLSSTNNNNNNNTMGGVFLVFEYCPQDLAQLIDQYYSKHSKSPFTEHQVKRLLQQLLSAIEFLHSHSLLHRDIKLSNLLYTSTGQLKLADFGLSRHYYTNDNDHQDDSNNRVSTTPISSSVALTPNVVSLWYRPPELLLGARSTKTKTTKTTTSKPTTEVLTSTMTTNYSSKIDLWAVGCVFGELLQGYPLLDGKDELEQILKMITCLGWPPSSLYPNVSRNTKLVVSLHETSSTSSSLSSKPLLDRFHYLSAEGLSLLTKLLEYDPDTRWSAKQALASPYFQQDPLPATDMPTFPSQHNV